MGCEFKSIIFPTDFSGTANAALKTALAIAEKYEADLHIVTVVETAAYLYAGYPYADLSDALAKAAAKRMQQFKLPVKVKKARVIPAVLEGDAGAQIIGYAAHIRCDLVVMASHARGSVARFFLGSVADKLLHETKCPVLVLRAPDSPKAIRKDRGFKRILVPTDFSLTADIGLGRAMAMAADYGAELHIFHVIEDEPIGLLDNKARKATLKDLEKIAQDKLDELATWDKQGLKIVTGFAHGRPSDQIAKYAAKVKADLLVIGSHGRGELSRLILGSVADRILRTVDLPVLIEHRPREKKRGKK